MILSTQIKYKCMGVFLRAELHYKLNEDIFSLVTYIMLKKEIKLTDDAYLILTPLNVRILTEIVRCS